MEIELGGGVGLRKGMRIVRWVILVNVMIEGGLGIILWKFSMIVIVVWCYDYDGFCEGYY